MQAGEKIIRGYNIHGEKRELKHNLSLFSLSSHLIITGKIYITHICDSDPSFLFISSPA